jgi:3-dehydroquinate synthase
MREVRVELGPRSYPIYIGNNLVYASDLYKRMAATSELMVVTDENVGRLYLRGVLDALADVRVVSHVIPAGEIHKNLDSMDRIVGSLLTNRFGRTSCIIALGGGVVGDLAGFAAACYQRGIRYVQVPTTLLAQVDSSVGGKTAVNHPLGKNMIGAFHQPAGVISDVSVLQTLPEREFRSGLAEVIKYGLIRDREFYDWLESNMDGLAVKKPALLEYAIERSCVNKAAVVTADEKETGLRAILNLGHTFGHAIETGLNYQLWLHGEAVGLGMLMAAHMSMLMGSLPGAALDRVKRLIQRAGLPVALPEELRDTDLRELMSVDKKASHGKLKLILLKDVGEVVITGDYKESVLQETIRYFHQPG